MCAEKNARPKLLINNIYRKKFVLHFIFSHKKFA